MSRVFIWTVASTLLLFGCTTHIVEVAQEPSPEPQVYTAVGYGFESSYKNYPDGQRRVLAIRAAKLDAYRSLAEEFQGTRIRGVTTVKDMAVENDSYRSYVDAVVRGARLGVVTPKGEGVYEAEVQLRLDTPVLSCLRSPTVHCLNRPTVHTVRCLDDSSVGCRSVTTINCHDYRYWGTSRCIDRFPEAYYVIP